MHDGPEVRGQGKEGPGTVAPDDAAEAGALTALVDQARSLDSPILVRQEAFSALVERYQDLAFGYAYALLGDPHLAQDATQEAFLAAYRHLNTLRAPEAFLHWLRRIVRTQCVRQRRSKEPATVPLDSPVAEDALETRPRTASAELATHTSPSDPATIIEARELQVSIARIVKALPPREREVTLLFYLSGYAQHEIAHFLEVPVNTVKKRLQSARRRLQERMLAMADDALRDYGREYLPSRDDHFIETVRFLTAFEAAAAEGELPMVEFGVPN